jgi:hypothetical protein
MTVGVQTTHTGVDRQNARSTRRQSNGAIHGREDLKAIFPSVLPLTSGATPVVAVDLAAKLPKQPRAGSASQRQEAKECGQGQFAAGLG